MIQPFPMKRRVLLLSACDRFNYGDLLFPIIAKKQLETSFEIVNVALVESDLRELGALPTRPYAQLYQRRGPEAPKDVILVAGGEVLGSDWSTLYSFISPAFRKVYDLFALRRTTRRWLESWTRRFRGFGEPMPFVPSNAELMQEVDFVFHAVGGSDTHESEYRDRIRKVFQSAQYVTAREQDTYRSLHDGLGCENVLLTPDSAILMSDDFPLQPSSIDRPYVCFQMREHGSSLHLETIRRELESLSGRTGFSIALLPIGNCAGHDDLVPLTTLHETLKCPKVLIRPKSISEVMMTIARSELYIGTSLHGIITAMSFERPYLGLDPTILKNVGYLRTWAPPGLQTITRFEEIAAHAESALRVPRSALSESLKEQKRRVRESFEAIRSRLGAPSSAGIGHSGANNESSRALA